MKKTHYFNLFNHFSYHKPVCSNGRFLIGSN